MFNVRDCITGIVAFYAFAGAKSDELSSDMIDIKSPMAYKVIDKKDLGEIKLEVELTIDDKKQKPAIMIVEMISADQAKNVQNSKGIQLREIKAVNNKIRVSDKLVMPRKAGKYRLRIRVVCDKHNGALKEKPKYLDFTVK
ncbi:MAG: hypothetical protein WCJ40_05395 [Planctomycetota bacterium]|nr:hypothetical protein [Planctomycetota bacterium]